VTAGGALGPTGSFSVWGSALYGQVGELDGGDLTQSGCDEGLCARVPRLVAVGNGGVVTFAFTWYATIVVTTDGSVWAFGRNLAGELGHSPAGDGTCAVNGQGPVPCNPVPVRAQLP
jgi:alpha-tubulin suppressor-like RCC1 family protein